MSDAIVGMAPSYGLISILIVGYPLYLAIYRLYFHSLKKYPGPKLAALTGWYEFYYECVLGGQFVFKLEELHKQYDISDPDAYNKYFAQSGLQSKYEFNANRFNNETSLFATVPPDHHKLRRNALENMFSRSQVRQLLPLLQAKTSKMLNLLQQYQAEDRICRIDRAMWSLSEDMIFEYALGISRGALDRKDFEDPLHEVFVKAGAIGTLVLQFPIINNIMNALPDEFIIKSSPDFGPLVKMRQSFAREYKDVTAPENGKSRSVNTHRTVFLDLWQNEDLPLCEKTEKRFVHEAQLVIGAGLSTVGWAATVGIWHILSNPPVLKKMREELFKVIPRGEKRHDCTDLDWAALEALPYFQGCVREALRLSYGMSSRSSRRLHSDFVYTESPYMSTLPGAEKDGTNRPGRTWVIPAYTAVSMSIPLVVHNEHIFPDSWTFNPERWIGPDKVPDKYLVVFGKGPRMCLGMQLAWAELSLMFAGLFRWYELELYETPFDNVRMARDATIPIPAARDGLRVKIKAEID